MTPEMVGAYLARIGHTDPVRLDRFGLEALQRAHLTVVPFENLDVVSRVPVSTSIEWSVPKIVERQRGGWCFELNGAFGALLEALGFTVMRLGAAVLLDGPTTVIDHLALEVQLDEPWLVDVGFGDSFIKPLALNRRGPQNGGSGEFEFLPSPQGTTLARLDGNVPIAHYRFKRVNHPLAAFNAVSELLQAAGTRWSSKPFATRLLDGGPDRVTLLSDELKITRSGIITSEPVAEADWDQVLHTWFSMTV